MKYEYNDDLFRDTTMTFGEHLDELRKCLFKAIAGLVVGTIFGFFLADYVVALIQVPLERALKQYYLEDAKERLATMEGAAVTPGAISLVQQGLVFERIYLEPSAILKTITDSNPELAKLKLPNYRLAGIDVLDPARLATDLRLEGASSRAGPGHRIWELLSAEERAAVEKIADAEKATPDHGTRLAAILDRLLAEPSFYRAEDFANVDLPEAIGKSPQVEGRSTDDVRLINWQLLSTVFPSAIAPPHEQLSELVVWRPIDGDSRVKAKSFNFTETFMIWFKAAIIAGFVLSSPWIFYQLWSFVGAGLYPHEKKYVHVFLPFSLGLFLLGVATAFFFVFDPVLNFLLQFNRSLGIDPDPRISEWLSFVLFLPVGFGIAFQLPLVMLFLERIGIFQVPDYLAKWRVAVLVIFVVSAILTPADPYSIFYMAVPLVLLYFVGILICKFLPRQAAYIEPAK